MAIRADDPQTLAKGDFNEGAWVTMVVLTQLMDRKGWLSSTALGEACGLGRDSVRRICRTLATQGWVRQETHDGTDVWTVGPELPRIGIQYQRLLQKQVEATAADFARTTEPFGGK